VERLVAWYRAYANREYADPYPRIRRQATAV